MKRRIGYSCGHVIEDEIPEDEVQRLEILLGRKVNREPYAGFPVQDKPCGKCVFEERAKTHHHAAGTAGCEACIKALLHGPTSPPAPPTHAVQVAREEPVHSPLPEGRSNRPAAPTPPPAEPTCAHGFYRDMPCVTCDTSAAAGGQS